MAPCRDTEHGIGPKRLGTICSLVLQRSLLQWLDDCQRELAREAAAKQLAAAVGAQHQAAAAAPQRPATEALSQMSPARLAPDATSPPATASASLGGDAAACPSIPEAAAVAQQAGLADVQEPAQPASPFAPLAGMPPSLSPRVSPVPHHRPSASAPATPADTRSGALAAVVVPASEGAVLGVAAAAPAGGQPADGEGPSDSSMQRMASLHGYMGLLSLKRPQVGLRGCFVGLHISRCCRGDRKIDVAAVCPAASHIIFRQQPTASLPPLHTVGAIAGCAARHAGGQRAAIRCWHTCHGPPAVRLCHAAGAQQQQQRPRGSSRHCAVGAGALPDRPLRPGGAGGSSCTGSSRCRQPCLQPSG